MLTLEDYFRNEYAEGKINFSLRVSVGADVDIYIHPSSCNGATTPTLRVSGNAVTVAPYCFHPDWCQEENK